MATLTNTKIKDTYVGLLKTTDNEAIDAAGVTLLEDGVGNASALSVGRANNGVTVTGTLTATTLTGTLSTAAQANITSVGTLSSLAVSGNLTVDTNTLFVDAANNRVGIGTSSPSVKLEVADASASPVFRLNNSRQGTWTTGEIISQIQTYIEDTTGIGARVVTNIKSISDFGTSTPSGAIVFETSVSNENVTEKVRITSSGNVGIGTASPALKLEVNSGDVNDVALFESTDQNATVTIKDSFQTTNLSQSSNIFSISVDPSNVHADSGFVVTTDGSERMRINSSGNVGIGTTSPSTKLDIAANNTAGTALNVLRFTDTDTSCVANQPTGRIEFFTSESDDSGVSSAISGLTSGLGAPTGQITFETAGTEKLRILATGGITFNGDTAAANALDDYEEGTWSPVYVPTAGSFATMTMDILTAKYTKIGNMVTVFANIQTDDVDVTGGTVSVRIGGLPFTISGTGGGIAIGVSIDFTNAPDGGRFVNNTTTLQLVKTGASANLAVADLTNGVEANHNVLQFTGTYMVS